jgi:hypothetical protein
MLFDIYSIVVILINIVMWYWAIVIDIVIDVDSDS